MPRIVYDAETRHRLGIALGREAARRYVSGCRGRPRRDVPPTPAQRLLEARDWVALEDAYEALSAREQKALDLRFGLNPNDSVRRPMEEISSELQISPSRVEQALARAVEKLDAGL